MAGKLFAMTFLKAAQGFCFIQMQMKIELQKTKAV